MREIKFRAQQSNTKEWRYFTLGDFVCRSEDLSTIDKGFDWKNWCEFTGLLDGKGKEIYEGDIFNNARWGNGYIKYSEASFYVWYPKKPMHSGQMGAASLGGFENIDLSTGNEVIGNIYENPELLGSAHSDRK